MRLETRNEMLIYRFDGFVAQRRIRHRDSERRTVDDLHPTASIRRASRRALRLRFGIAEPPQLHAIDVDDHVPIAIVTSDNLSVARRKNSFY